MHDESGICPAVKADPPEEQKKRVKKHKSKKTSDNGGDDASNVAGGKPKKRKKKSRSKSDNQPVTDHSRRSDNVLKSNGDAAPHERMDSSYHEGNDYTCDVIPLPECNTEGTNSGDHFEDFHNTVCANSHEHTLDNPNQVYVGFCRKGWEAG